VFTKCERVWDERGRIGASLRASSIRRECEASLRRLKSDVIDLNVAAISGMGADIVMESFTVIGRKFLPRVGQLLSGVAYGHAPGCMAM
jgi:hypothetical protein